MMQLLQRIPPFPAAGTVQSWFEEHEGELQHLHCPAQSPDLISTKPVWSVLETRVRNRSPPPTSLEQFEDVLQEEWDKIPLETVQNLSESAVTNIGDILKAKHGPTPY
jgi:hypothetical protein